MQIILTGRQIISGPSGHIAGPHPKYRKILFTPCVTRMCYNSSIYTQLAAIYQTGGNLSGILQLQEAAAQLAPFPQKIILEKLKSFQP